MFDRLRHLFGVNPSKVKRGFLSVREKDIPDEDERKLYEVVLNRAMRGESVLGSVGPDGVTIGETKYASIDEAHDVEKQRY